MDTAAATRITTYQGLFAAKGDVLCGTYDTLMELYRTGEGTLTGEALMEHVLAASQDVPKVFVALTRGTAVDDYYITAFHRPTGYTRDPVRTSGWDGNVYAFHGDVLPGNFINMLQVPANAFQPCPGQRVPTVAQTTALAASGTAGTLLPALPAGAPDSEKWTTRYCIQVPHAYVPLVLARNLTPLQAWSELGGAIISDGRQAELQPLLGWLRVAATASLDRQTGNPGPPANFIGDQAGTLPVAAADADLQRHRWSVLCQDLPALDPKSADDTDRVMAFASIVRAEAARNEASRQAERAAATAPKTPGAAFPLTAPLWRLLAGVADDDGLPELYHAWANSSKAERRVALSRLLEDRARDPSSAGITPPVATKELYEMVLQGKVAPHVHQVNDLTAGVSPFTCGFLVGQQGSPVQVRVERYDLALQGLIAPTVAEQETFRTREVPLPASTYQCGTMLQATSMVVDVIQGVMHPHSRALRNFCMQDWPEMLAMLEQSGVAARAGNILPRICREVQSLMGVYYRRLLAGGLPSVPNYSGIAEKVLHGQFSLLLELPMDLAVPAAQGPAPRGAPVQPSAPPSRRDPGAAVRNPRPVQAWMTALTESGLRLATVRRHAPSTQHNGRAVDLCLSYHVRGSCFESCERAATHRSPTPAERAALSTFVQQHVRPDGARPTNPAPPAADQTSSSS